MISALLTALVLAADPPPPVIALEVGLVRIAPHRPGTDQTWVIPAEKKQQGGGFCTVAAAGMALTGVGVPFAGMAKTLCDTAATTSGSPAQARMETSPDIYVRLTGAKVMLRSYTVARTLSNTFRWRAVVPVAAIPKSGLVLEVLNDDGGPDEEGREVIGQTRLSADKLLSAASTGSLITMADNGVEKLELLVEAASTSPRHKTQTLDVRNGIVAVDALPVTAGEVAEVQARGEYRVAGHPGSVPPTGAAGTASHTFQDGPFKAGAPGAALVRVGKRRLTTGALVTPCAALLSPYEGVLFAGINNQDPRTAQGDLEFDVTVRPATDEEWRTGTVAECKSEAAPQDDGALAAFEAKVVQRLRENAGLASAILSNTHPTGKNPTPRSIDIDPASQASARVLVTVDWKGGVLGGAHSTKVAWEFNTRRHIAATLVSDSANVRVTPEYLKKLDAFFRDEVFPSVK